VRAAIPGGLFLHRWTAVAFPSTDPQHQRELIYRASPVAQGTGLPIALFLHGRSGNENSMEVFASSIPDRFLKIFPRGIFPDPDGGFGWHQRLAPGHWPDLDDFQPAVGSLDILIQHVQGRKMAETAKMIVIGFSQGAALGCAFTLALPDRVRALVMLSGYVPETPQAIRRQPILAGKPVFVAHGTEDPLVPIALANRGIVSLKALGANVHDCRARLGHKVSADCLRALREWLHDLPA